MALCMELNHVGHLIVYYLCLALTMVENKDIAYLGYTIKNRKCHYKSWSKNLGIWLELPPYNHH